VIIDRTLIRGGTGPARLLDMVEGRSKQAFKQWLSGRPEAWRDGVEVVAMDGFTGFKTAAAEEIPAAVAVMDPCHVVRLAGDALDKCRRRVLAIHGHRGHKDDPHVEVEATWGIYQRMIAVYRQPDRTNGRELMQNLIGSVSAGVPAALSEVITLGRTLKKHAVGGRNFRCFSSSIARPRTFSGMQGWCCCPMRTPTLASDLKKIKEARSSRPS
jgi:transposase